MAGLRSWLDTLSPDISTTLRRFPLPVLLAACGTLVFILVNNQWVDTSNDAWMRAFVGIATAAAFAVAGKLYAEDRPEPAWLALILQYVVPIAIVALFQWRSTVFFLPYLMPVVGVLAVSVVGFTRRGSTPAGKAGLEDRFWWANHLAVASALIAAAGFVIIGLGAMAIERSLAILFGFEIGDLIYRVLLPVAGFFLAPVYWLATIPRADQFDAKVMEQPDFFARSVGFLGQFLFVPLLLAYSLILFAYAVQIVVTRSLPEGMLGWMVLGFTVTGAMGWLLLHPAFLRDRLLVRVFRRWWFWLTIVPLILYGVAVGVRIDAYGLTFERMLLVAGGIWAALLTLAYLAGRGDIRLIPGLAALVLLALSIGPWNAMNLPRWHQLQRLDAALAAAYAGGATPAWTTESAAKARGALDYLIHDPDAATPLTEVLAARGVPFDPASGDTARIYEALQIPTTEPDRSLITARRDWRVTTADVSATPVLLGPVTAWAAPTDTDYGLRFQVQGTELLVWLAAAPQAASVSVALTPLLRLQTGDVLAEPWIDFTIGGNRYRLVLNDASITRPPDAATPPSLTSISGILFTAPATN